MFAKNIMNECDQLYKPIQKLINKLKTRKIKGLDKNSNDIDPLIDALNQLKQLNEVEFHSSIRKVLPYMESMDEKENININFTSENISKLEEDIDNIEYDVTVKQTKDMLTEYKDTISKEGLNKNIIQRNQAKRLGYLKELAMKCRALIKSCGHVCSQHLGMQQEEFKKTYIKPCTKRMGKDIQQMQKETDEAFTKEKLNIKDLQRANACLETFYAVKNVFEKELNDDQLCTEIQVDKAINTCENTATERVKKITKEIQETEVKNDDVGKYMEKTAENLMNLEYLNQHIIFKTTVNENTNQPAIQNQNELHKEVETAIKKSMKFLTNNEETKGKINVLYNHIIDADPNYGVVFTQGQRAFESSRARAMNQKFRELKIDPIIDNLRQTEQEMKEQNLFMTNMNMVGVDYDKIKETFNVILKMYDDLVWKNLTSAKSFEQLKQDMIPSLANDAKCRARQALNSKETLLDKMLKNGVNLIKGTVSWLTSNNNNSTNDPRDAYWTSDMRHAVPELIAYVLSVWTLSKASCYYECSDKNKDTLMRARNAQIVAICCVLCLDVDLKQKKLINNLVEVGTGEGKSVIMAITATVLALLDFDVYCACYSSLLSKRDQNAFNDLFVKFGVQNNIQYQTFNNVLENMINDGGDVREITKHIVLGDDDDDSEISDDDESDDEKKQNTKIYYYRQKILFIDEVDKFFSTDFFGKQYTPSCVIPKQEMKNLILFVWNEYVNSNFNSNSITLKKIHDSIEFNNLKSSFNKEWHQLLEESMKDMIDGIRTFKDDSYKIEKGKDICYKFSDTYSSKVFYGFKTLFTYLFELHHGNIKDKNYVHRKLTWFLKCGSFSYSEIPHDFYGILGVTGTLKSLSKKEHEVIQISYGIKKYIVMPSLFDKTAKLEYSQNKDIALVKREYFYDEIHATVQLYLQNDIDSIDHDRPVIIFFKDETTLNYFYNSDACKEWRVNDRIQLLTPDLTENEKKTGILNATKPNCITFATEEYGRGIDFKVYDKKLEKKGMHVELTYWPETLAEQIQIKGRTARQGDRGSFHIILNQNEIIDQCKVPGKDIEMHKKNGDIYNCLNVIRSKVFEKQYNEAASYVKELKPIHKDSEELAKALRTNNIKIAKRQLLLFNKGANIHSDAKLSVLIDATGSMWSCLNQCKTVIQKTIPQLVKFLKKNNIPTDSFEVQIIAYRNYGAGADNILEFCSFTSNESKLTKFIHSVKASYGWGDEALEVALGQLNRQQKKPNVVLLMADAPAQTKNQMIRKRQKYGNKYWKTERDGIFKKLKDWNDELTTFMTANQKAQFFCFYLTNSAKSNFDKIAKIGKGKSMYLNINDEKKSIKLLQSALAETILLKMNNGEMGYVQQFRKQNENMPTFL